MAISSHTTKFISRISNDNEFVLLTAQVVGTGALMLADFVNDPDAKPIESGADGTVVLEPDGSFTYTPEPGFTGVVRVTDGPRTLPFSLPPLLRTSTTSLRVAEAQAIN